MTWASSFHHARTMKHVGPRSRRRCHCGCEGRATHHGLANGVALALGCELFIRRWVRDGNEALLVKRRLRERLRGVE